MSETASSISSEGNQGEAPFKVAHETFSTWYIIFGDINSGVTPLVVLHGGPGVSHHYMLSLTDLVKTHNIPVVIYDQIGVYNSNKPEWHLKEKPTSFWKLELFMDELENILSHLKISDNFNLLGHSWGGMLGAQFAAQRQPKGLKKLILSSSPASEELWLQAAGKLLDELPKDIRDTLKKHEEAGTTDSQEFQEAMNVFNAKHVIRMDPLPEPVNVTFTNMAQNPWLYILMIGPSEFICTGTLKTWNIISELHKINVPTLILNGEYDEAQDLVVQPFFEHIAKVKWVKIPDASHMAHWEQREKYIKIVGYFLE